MVGDLSFGTKTTQSFQLSVKDVQVYLLQDLQCKDFLTVMKKIIHAFRRSNNNNNNNFINLYCANINPENFHLRITITQQNPKILNIFKLTKSLIYND